MLRIAEEPQDTKSTVFPPKSFAELGATPSPPPPVSDMEAEFYYAGLPSGPVLIARTGSTPWEAPTGMEAYPKLKELRVVGDHRINDIWEDDLAAKVHAILHTVDWTSTDVVRIGYVDQPSGDVILWIGVKPDSLSYSVGIDVALQCKRLLLDYGIDDVGVEIRQSEVIRLTGAQLLQPTFDSNPTVDVREPFTATLGITICAQSTPWAEGTGGFFLDEGGDGKRLLLATARHVIFPQSDNNLFEYKSESQRRHNVLVLSEASFQQHLVSIKDETKTQDVMMSYHTARIKKVAGREDGGAILEHEHAQRMLKLAEAKVKGLNAFHQELLMHWATDDSRILGHVIFSPPIAVGTGTEQYTQDLAIIDIDASKIDPSSFVGNVIDLGTEFPPALFTAMMCPNPRNSHNFVYPGDRLLSLRGTITDNEMRKPTMYDQNNNRCMMVIKRGRTTGVTIGRANNIFSYTRNYGDVSGVSKQWVILPFNKKSGVFSAKGDSGSVVVDGAGQVGGLLTGGGGVMDSFDVTYVTPISFVLKVIHGNKSLANANLKSGPSA